MSQRSLRMSNTRAGDGGHTQDHPLSALLMDGINEVIALAPNGASRAAAITALVREIYDTVEWVNGPTTGNRELASLGRVLAEARHHNNQMSATALAPAAARDEMNGVQALDTSAGADSNVSSYDDLSVAADRLGRVVLECPACGSIPVPLRDTTLSDLTNVAMEHLSERHAYTLTLPSRRSRAAGGKASGHRDRMAAPSGYFTEHFWSLIALLGEDGAGIEALVRALAGTSEDDIVAFQDQLQSALNMLDTPQHRVQQVHDVDDPLQTAPAGMSDALFERVSLAVVAAGRDVWLDIMAEPSHLAGGWSLHGSLALRDAHTAALQRMTSIALQPTTTAEHQQLTA